LNTPVDFLAVQPVAAWLGRNVSPGPAAVETFSGALPALWLPLDSLANHVRAAIRRLVERAAAAFVNVRNTTLIEKVAWTSAVCR
jgi:hypothetical protein